MTDQDVPGERIGPYPEGLGPVGADGDAPAVRQGLGPATSRPRRSSAGRRGSVRTWLLGLVCVLVLLALIVFIAQNTANAEIAFLGFSGSLPLAAALLAAALAGAVVTAAVGAARGMVRNRAARRGR